MFFADEHYLQMNMSCDSGEEFPTLLSCPGHCLTHLFKSLEINFYKNVYRYKLAYSRSKKSSWLCHYYVRNDRKKISLMLKTHNAVNEFIKIKNELA